MKSNGEAGHPWRIPRLMLNCLDVPKGKEIELLMSEYNKEIKSMKFCLPKPKQGRAFKIKGCSTYQMPYKSLKKESHHHLQLSDQNPVDLQPI